MERAVFPWALATTPESVDILFDHVHAHASARHVGDRLGGGDSGLKQQGDNGLAAEGLPLGHEALGYGPA